MLRSIMPALLAAAFAARPAFAQESYGARGIFPVYESGGQWVVFDKRPAAAKNDAKLAPGSRLLVVGSSGAQVFDIARTSAMHGSMCRKNRPVKLRAALLKGPRRAVGRPIIGIAVPPGFSLKGSQAAYKALSSEVGEDTYARLLEPLKRGENVQIKIDFGAAIPVRGLKAPFVFIEETQSSSSSRRCLRLADGGALVGECVEMPRALMAETNLLQFVSYDPSGGGAPLLLAFTKVPPMWGEERWGFALRETGPKLLLSDALDPRCRDAF